MLLGGPSGFPPILFFVPLSGWCPGFEWIPARCGSLHFLWLPGWRPVNGCACLANLDILVPGILVPGILQGILLVLSNFREVL